MYHLHLTAKQYPTQTSISARLWHVDAKGTRDQVKYSVIVIPGQTEGLFEIEPQAYLEQIILALQEIHAEWCNTHQ